MSGRPSLSLSLAASFCYLHGGLYCPHINHAKQEGWWVSYSLKQFNNPPTHLALADDFILFTKASPKEINVSWFCQASGQNINLGKSKLLLSSKFSNSFHFSVCEVLCMGILLPF